MGRHHVVVLVPRVGGGWRAHFPDFPGCRAEGCRVESAVVKAGLAVAELIARLHARGKHVPAPQSYEAVRADDAWARERGIDWSQAVISLVPVRDSD